MMARIRSIDVSQWGTWANPWAHGPTLYVIKERGGYVKIGVASHPVRRVQALQCGNPRPLEIVALYAGTKKSCHEVERLTHRYFGVRHQKGEWVFADTADVIKFIKTFCGDA